MTSTGEYQETFVTPSGCDSIVTLFLNVSNQIINSIRIKNINKRLHKVHKQHDLGRKARIKNELPMISLAGYTNAGKSTLFNRLTKSEVYADDKLFATLDSTIRRVILPAAGEAVIADTVGFIQDLPHELVEAFKSTL